MKSLYLKKTGKIAGNIAKLIVIEGLISVGSSYLRDISKTNCNTTKDSLRQINNLTRNAINGNNIDDWDDL